MNQKSTAILPLVTDDKLLDLSKYKAFEDDKSKMAKLAELVLDIVENIVGKGENAGYQHFLISLRCFQKVSFSG